ncbi:MAG: hypothetical protein PHE77_01545 [Candidatus Pacebacteria bacterium]|nr:hypothetical protein [Candidatus Paceibacterota bacterium]
MNPNNQSNSSTTNPINYAHDFYGCSEEVAQKIAKEYDRQLARQKAVGKAPRILPTIATCLRVRKKE